MFLIFAQQSLKYSINSLEVASLALYAPKHLELDVYARLESVFLLDLQDSSLSFVINLQQTRKLVCVYGDFAREIHA